jgi:tRNA-dihydrouridine synthase B
MPSAPAANKLHLPLGDFPLTLAPMVGLSHLAMRRLIKRYMPEGHSTIWPTEMLSTRRLPSQALGNTPETLRDEDENHLVPQILGNEERFITPSLKKLELWGAVGIDINMGCPVKRALRHNYGVALMGDPKYATEIVRMTVQNTKLPVSVKLRSGESSANKEHDLLKFCEQLHHAGAAWICLHPRYGDEKRRGVADWNQITLLKKHLDIPIIGNGDVQTFQDAIDMKEQTGCDLVMIGRALTARPWLFWQFAEKLGLASPVAFKGLKAPASREEEAYAYGDALLFFAKQCVELFDEKSALKKIKFFIFVSNRWLNFGHTLYAKSSHISDIHQMLEMIELFFHKNGLEMTQKTDLRY